MDSIQSKRRFLICNKKETATILRMTLNFKNEPVIVYQQAALYISLLLTDKKLLLVQGRERLKEDTESLMQKVVACHPSLIRKILSQGAVELKRRQRVIGPTETGIAVKDEHKQSQQIIKYPPKPSQDKSEIVYDIRKEMLA